MAFITSVLHRVQMGSHKGYVSHGVGLLLNRWRRLSSLQPCLRDEETGCRLPGLLMDINKRPGFPSVDLIKMSRVKGIDNITHRTEPFPSWK